MVGIINSVDFKEDVKTKKKKKNAKFDMNPMKYLVDLKLRKVHQSFEIIHLQFTEWIERMSHNSIVTWELNYCTITKFSH